MTLQHANRLASSLAALKDLDAAFDRCFGVVAFQWNRYLIDHSLRECSRGNVRRFPATADVVMRCLCTADAQVAADPPAEATTRDVAAATATTRPAAP